MDESVVAIPSSWIVKKGKQLKCDWPIKNNKIAKYIEKCVPPNESDFKLLPVR